MAGVAALGIAVVGLISGNRNASATRTQNNAYLQQQYEAEYNTAQANLAVAQANSAASYAYAGELASVAAGQRETAKAIAASGQDAYNLAVENAGFIREEGSEDVRRQELVNDEVEGLVLARQAASGVKTSSKSAKLYYNDTIDSNSQIVSWMNKATESKALLEEERGVFERTLAEISSQQALSQADATEASANNSMRMADVGVLGAEAAFAGLIKPEPVSVAKPKKKLEDNTDQGGYK